VFSAQADIILPEGLGVDDLRNALETITADIMVDIEMAAL
jgi:glycine cleavage system regulatory protein